MKLKTSEKSVRLIEAENTIVIVVGRRIRKAEIRKQFEEIFGAKVKRINTSITRGKKTAYVQLNKETPAIDIATKFGMI